MKIDAEPKKSKSEGNKFTYLLLFWNGENAAIKIPNC